MGSTAVVPDATITPQSVYLMNSEAQSTSVLFLLFDFQKVRKDI